MILNLRRSPSTNPYPVTAILEQTQAAATATSDKILLVTGEFAPLERFKSGYEVLDFGLIRKDPQAGDVRRRRQ